MELPLFKNEGKKFDLKKRQKITRIKEVAGPKNGPMRNHPAWIVK